jgi:hypothetical protein
MQIHSPLTSKAHGLGCGGTRFYIAGLACLLLGTFLGTGSIWAGTSGCISRQSRRFVFTATSER